MIDLQQLAREFLERTVPRHRCLRCGREYDDRDVIDTRLGLCGCRACMPEWFGVPDGDAGKEL